MSNQSIRQTCRWLLENCRTMMLATVNEDGRTHASYAPFVYADARFYILVSALAEHSANLHHANQVGCMIIEDEITAKQVFARRRLMFKSRVGAISREHKSRTQIMNDFQNRFGQVIDVLDSLPDFTLFELRPLKIVLVKGFGDAHEIASLRSGAD